MCSFFATSFTAEGVVSVDVMVMVSTGARGPVRKDREVQLAADAEVRRCLVQLWDIAMRG